MKKSKLLSILISSYFLFTSCSNEKKIDLYGYVYKGEKITVLQDKKDLFNKNIKATNIDSNMVCFLNEELKVKSSNVKLNIKIDSSNICVLDTSLIVPENFKNPFINFVYPAQKSKRKIFVADHSMFVEAD